MTNDNVGNLSDCILSLNNDNNLLFEGEYNIGNGISFTVQCTLTVVDKDDYVHLLCELSDCIQKLVSTVNKSTTEPLSFGEQLLLTLLLKGFSRKISLTSQLLKFQISE